MSVNRFDTIYIEPSTERLIVALIIATLIHFVLIYGVGFSLPKPNKPLNTTMEIVLVQKRTDDIPKKADYLAQATHQGGGQDNSKDHASTPIVAPFPSPQANVIFTPPPTQQVTHVQPNEQTEILTTDNQALHQVPSQTYLFSLEEPSEQEDISQEDSMFEEYISENALFIDINAAKLASIQAELDQKFNSYTKRLRHKHISASTKEYKYANYMEYWRKKVEQIGNTNYPDEARRRKLSGSLVLDVAINPNGTVRHVEIKKPSQYKILDEAALRIVRLAAPFDPFSEDIRKETDVLHITRTWEFRYNSLSSR